MTVLKSRTFIFIAGTGLAVRIALWLWVGWHENKIYTGDGKEFEQIAFNLAEYGLYSKSVNNPSIPDTRRTPVYPVWIAVWKIITGMNYHPMIVTGTHMVFYLAIAAMIWIIACRAFSPAVSAVALSFYCFDLSGIANGSLLMAETLYAFFCIFFAFLLVQSHQHRQYRWSAFAGIALGLMTLTKPMSFYFIFLFAPVAVYLFIRKKEKRKYIAVSYSVLFFLFFLTVSPWMARNYSVAGIVQVSSIQDYQLLFYQAATVKAKAENITRNEAVDRIRHEIGEEQKVFDEDIVTGERLARYRQKALAILSDHWGVFLSYYLISKFIILVDPDRFTIGAVLYEQPEDGFFNRIGNIGGINGSIGELFQRKEFIVILTINFLLLLLSVTGMVVTLLRLRSSPHKRPVILILLFILVLHIAMTGLTPWARFRVMFHPLMALVAAPGVYWMLEYVKKTVHKKFRINRGNFG